MNRDLHFLFFKLKKKKIQFIFLVRWSGHRTHCQWINSYRPDNFLQSSWIICWFTFFSEHPSFSPIPSLFLGNFRSFSSSKETFLRWITLLYFPIVPCTCFFSNSHCTWINCSVCHHCWIINFVKAASCLSILVTNDARQIQPFNKYHFIDWQLVIPTCIRGNRLCLWS